MAKFSWGGRTESIFLQIFLHGENGTVMEIQSKTKEFCPNIKKTCRVESLMWGWVGKPETHNLFFLALVYFFKDSYFWSKDLFYGTLFYVCFD